MYHNTEFTQVQIRVIKCLLSTPQSNSLSEVTTLFNKRYPPSFILKLAGVSTSQKEILKCLKVLEENKLVRWDVFSFTNKVLTKSEKYYSLTQKGMQFFNKRKNRET